MLGSQRIKLSSLVLSSFSRLLVRLLQELLERLQTQRIRAQHSIGKIERNMKGFFGHDQLDCSLEILQQHHRMACIGQLAGA